MRRTSGSPASAVSIGIATDASSSSEPIAGFWTMTLKTGADRSGKTSRRSCPKLTAPNAVATRTTRMVNAGRAKAADMRRLVIGASMAVLVATASAFLGLGLQQKRPFNDDRLASLQSGDHLHVVAEVAPAADRPHLVFVLLLRDKRQPPFADALQRGGGHGENGATLTGHFEPRGGRHTGPKRPRSIRQFHADRDGARAGIDLTADHRHLAVELLPRKSRDGDMRGAADRHVDRVAFEHLRHDPDPAQVGDHEQRAGRLGVLTEDCASVEHLAGDRRSQVEE